MSWKTTLTHPLVVALLSGLGGIGITALVFATESHAADRAANQLTSRLDKIESTHQSEFASFVEAQKETLAGDRSRQNAQLADQDTRAAALLETLRNLDKEAEAKIALMRQMATDCEAQRKRVNAVAELAELSDAELPNRIATILKGDAKLVADLLKQAEALFPTHENVNSLTRRVDATEQELANGTPPVGTVAAWSVDTDPPRGWEICDGEPIDIHRGEGNVPQGMCSLQFANLIGTTYGAAGPNQVKLPDFRGTFLRGSGSLHDNEGRPIKDRHSLEMGKRQTQSTARPAGDAKRRKGGYGDVLTNQNETNNSYPRGGVNSGVRWDRASALVDWNPETRPVNYAVHWIIRVR